MGGALEGIVVVDFAQEMAGPFSTAFLADMGATVYKIERRGGEFGRRGGPAYMAVLNRGKKGLTLDLKRAEAREIVHKLVARADVVVSNWLPGVMERLGFGYDDLLESNETIVYAVGTSFGTEGPWATRPSRDTIGQAAGGLMSVTGFPDRPPVPVGAIVADATTGMVLANGILAALFHRERTGQGQKIEVSLYGTVLAMQSWEITAQAFDPNLPIRQAGRNHSFAMRGVWGSFPTLDGYLCIAGCMPEQWHTFCELLGITAYEDDPLISDSMLQMENEDYLWTILDPVFATKTTNEWIEILSPHKFLVSPVRTYKEVLEDDQAWANGYLRMYPDPDLGDVPMVAHPVKMSKTPPEFRGPAPTPGQHTDDILASLGYGTDEIEKFRIDEVI